MISFILFLASFAFLVLFLTSLKKAHPKFEKNPESVAQKRTKKQYGHLQVFFGSQTGTAAKMAQSFAEQANEKGWNAQVIDLQNISFNHLDRKGQISVFFLANTGEGQPPENTVKFMQILKKKQQIDEVNFVDWKKVAFTVFSLGNTQYEFYNKTGIDTDALLQTRGAYRVYKLGLGDNNASLEDDYIEWKNQLWEVLAKYRSQHSLEQKLDIVENKEQIHESKVIQKIKRRYLSAMVPEWANFRFYICEKQSQRFLYTEDDLDFKTKASLKSESSKVRSIKEIRQNTKDGSTLELQIQLQNNPFYQTAGNIGLYPKNDPKQIQWIISYFKFTSQQLQSYISIEKVSLDKKLRLNFIPYCKLIDLLESHIDLQGRLTKSVLKKLSKFNSNNKNYFVENSNPKTTQEFKRITEEYHQEKGWYSLLRIILQMNVQITFEDFVQLSDSIAPRLFTIASSYKMQKNVIIAASIIENGLISKFLNSKPLSIKTQLRKSTFTDSMKWKRVIFISAGTGFAPFRGYLQQKQLLMINEKKGQIVSYPNITIFFGCKRKDGDFLYKQDIIKWIQNKVINQFYPAFSRQQQQVNLHNKQKIYVQNLLEKQSIQLKKFFQEQSSAIYICGSLSMGHDVTEVLAKSVGGHEKLKQLELNKRIIKQLW